MKNLIVAVLLFSTYSANAMTILENDLSRLAKKQVEAIELAEETEGTGVTSSVDRVLGNTVLVTSVKTFEGSAYTETTCWEVEFAKNQSINSVTRVSDRSCF